MRFLKVSIRSHITSTCPTCFSIHNGKTPNHSPGLQGSPCMIWPSLTSPALSPTLCPSFPIARHRGPPSGPQRPNLIPTSGPLPLLFPLPGMLFPESIPQKGEGHLLRDLLTSLVNSVLPIVPSGAFVSFLIPSMNQHFKHFVYARACLFIMQGT